MFYSDCVVLKLCVVFLHMAKQATMLFDFHNMAFKNFWLEVANKKPLSTLNLPLHEFKFPVKKGIFFATTKFCIPGYYTENMLLIVSKNE